MKKFELVVPAYNEGPSLKKLVKKTIEVAQKHKFTTDQFSLILVNNGSNDNSSEIINELMKGPSKAWIKPISVKHNRGYGWGLLQGLKATSAQYIGWSHADLQCDPNDAFLALSLILSKTEQAKVLVKGVRQGRNWKDQIVTSVFEFLAQLILGLKANEINAQPKVFSQELLLSVTDPPLTFAFDLYVLYQAQKLGYHTKTIEVHFPPRIHGTSKWASNFLGRYKTILGMIFYMFKLLKKEGRL